MAKKYYPQIKHQNAMAFCVENGITISPELIKKNTLRLNIRIERDGMVKNIVSPRTYTNKELWEPIYEIYLTYFLKLADEDTIKFSNDKYLSFSKID